MLAQDHGSLEVIVVDDGSTDDTGGRMRDRYGHDPRVVYLRQPNGGVCVARNTGMARARGEFIAMLDSDDVWLPGKLRAQVAVFRKHPQLSLVGTDMAEVNPEGEVLSPKYLRMFYSAHRFFPRPSDLFARELATDDGTTYWIGEIAHAMLLGNLIRTSRPGRAFGAGLGRLARHRRGHTGLDASQVHHSPLRAGARRAVPARRGRRLRLGGRSTRWPPCWR